MLPDGHYLMEFDRFNHDDPKKFGKVFSADGPAGTVRDGACPI
jgi:hypothetical protein